MAGSNLNSNSNSQHHTLAQEQLQHERLEERAVLVACLLPDSKADPRDPLGELQALAETAGAIVVGTLVQSRSTPQVSTYIGKGKIEELKGLIAQTQASLVIFDNDLAPAQIRNIEKILNVKIIDRSELILDIFAGRAVTAAARLQVELAQLEYTYPRLRAMWSHLGQVTGGAPMGIGTRGPGETQLETDRRLVQRRRMVLKRRLSEVLARRTREVARRRQENHTVCFVGYTNAGKSTLFNALTGPEGGGAYADDRLFATLTTRTRRWKLGQGEEVMLSDTIGFVRELPHHLVASFRATLEEAIHADVLLIVIDVSDPMASMHADIVRETLDEIFDDEPKAPTSDDSAGWIDESTRKPNAVRSPAPESARPPSILVLNKADRLADESELAIWAARHPEAIATSAVTGRGLEELRQRVRALLSGAVSEHEVVVPYHAARALADIEARGEVLDRSFEEAGTRLRVRIGQSHVDRLRSMGVLFDASSA